MNKKKLVELVSETVKESIKEFGIPYNLGNIFETKQNIDFRDELLKRNAYLNTSKAEQNLHQTIVKIVNDRLLNVVPQPIVFFRNYANIFCSWLRFKIDDVKKQECLLKVIRTSFYNGEAGILIDGDNWIPCSVVRYVNQKNLMDDYEYVEVGNCDYILQATTKPNIENTKVRKIKLKYDDNKNCINFVSFKWGREAMSAWIWLWPYILQEHQIYRQLALSTNFMVKKLAFSVKDPTQAQRDLELLIDPYVPAIIDASGDDGELIKNKVKWLDEGGEYNHSIIDYINKWEALMAHKFGLRNNTDINSGKDRSLTSEVEASQSYYDDVEYNVLIEWDLFIKKLQIIYPNIENLSPINENNREEKVDEIRKETEKYE